MDKKLLNDQTRSAFEFIEKLYAESSYLVKEIEGLLRNKEEIFVIGKQRGYQISASASSGLNSPEQWIYKKLCAYFVPETMTKIIGGRTETSFSKDLKIIYLIIILSEEELKSPQIAIGILSRFKKLTVRFPKLEYFIISYIDRIWNSIKELKGTKHKLYKDSSFEFNVNFVIKDLYDVNSIQDIEKKLVNPALRMFRKS